MLYGISYSFNFPLPECPMRKLSCNMTTPTEETDSDSFNKLIDITDVYTQAECGGKGHLQEKSVENSLKLKQHFFSPEKV